MESVALNSLRVEASWDRQKFGDARHAPVKRGVKAGHLREFRVTPAECLDQLNLLWQMFWVVRPEAIQIIQQVLADQLGLCVCHSMDHAVSQSLDRSESVLFHEPVDQTTRSRRVIGGCDAHSVLLIPVQVVERKVGASQAYAIDLSAQPSLQRFANLVQRELDAG